MLAELKRGHVDDVEKEARKRNLTKKRKDDILDKYEPIDRIPAPAWTAALLTPAIAQLQSSGGELCDEEGHDDEEDDAGEHDSEADQQGRLSRLSADFRRAERGLQVAELSLPSAAEHCIEAVCRVAESHGDQAVHAKPTKKPRGNAAFFYHMSAVQCATPRAKGESLSAWKKRVADEARASWEDWGSFGIFIP